MHGYAFMILNFFHMLLSLVKIESFLSNSNNYINKILLGRLENPIAHRLIEMLPLCSGLAVSMVTKYVDNIVKVSMGNAIT